MLPNKPCDNCIHKKVCEASKKFDEIDVKITHPFFKARIECTEFQSGTLIRKGETILSPEYVEKH